MIILKIGYFFKDIFLDRLLFQYPLDYEMADGIKAGEIIVFELIIILESSLHKSEENNDLLEVTTKEREK